MSSFLSDAAKQDIRSIMDSIHDTFARDITIYKFGQKVAIATTAGYNSIYKKNVESSPSELVQISQVIKARIKYIKFDQGDFSQNQSQEKIVIPEGSVNIKVDHEGYLFIKDAKTAELDGFTFAIKGVGQPEGIFGPQFYKFLLIPLEA